MSSADVDLLDEKKSQGLVEYLQAPRKKRKDYVVLALGKDFDKDIGSGIEIFIKKNYTQYAIVSPKNEKDLQRIFSRQIVLLIIDDTFRPLEQTIRLVAHLKQRKGPSATPVLFLTEYSEQLIRLYHEHLISYQEIDNYVSHRNMPQSQINARIQTALTLNQPRRSRRFNIKIMVSYLYLAKNSNEEGELIDLSVHGGVLKANNGTIFRTSDQLLLRMPSNGLLPANTGDFFRLSAKVRRVFMGGSKVGISWEYLSEDRLLLLTNYVTDLVNRDMLLKTRRDEA